MEGNVEYALYYAPPGLREEFGDRLFSVPNTGGSPFRYAERCDILKGIHGLCHAGYVLGNGDGLHYVDTMIDRLPRSGAFQRGRKPILEVQEFGWI